MAIISPTPKLQFFGNDGNLLAGGKLYTYLAGTNVPSATFTDYTETTYNTNPVILDSRGEANIWLSSSIKYKFALQDASGAPIYTVDNVNTTSSGGGGGGGGSNVTGDFSNPVLASRSYAITTTVNGITSFGAVPNGTATLADFTAYNSSTPANSSFAKLSISGQVEARLESGALGAGTQLPLNLYTNGTLRANFDTAGNANLTGSLTNTGPVTSTGPASVFRVARRDTSAYAWGIYSNTGALQFYNNTTAADMVTFGPAGQIGIGSPPNYGTTGQSIVSQGAGSPPVWASPSAGASGFSNMVTLTTVGAGSWTVPAGVTVCKATVVAGGGGGGGGSGGYYGLGGGGAGASIKYITGLTPGASIAVTIGAGGTAGVGNNSSTSNSGGAGGTSSFGAFCSATGGAGGTYNAYSTGYIVGSGAGGAGANGNVNLVAAYAPSPDIQSASASGGGCGGINVTLNTYSGMGAQCAINGLGSPGYGVAYGSAGVAASGYGSGGSGGNGSYRNGGAGSPGIIIIEY